MQTIQSAKTFPNGTPIDSVEAKISAVYERIDMPNGAYGPTTVQKALIEDVAGNKMYIKAWGHPALDKMKGMDVVIHASGGKGVKVVHETYTPKGKTEPVTTIMLEISKVGQFQTVAVFKQNNPSTEAPKPVVAPTPAKTEGAPKAAGLAANGHLAGKPIHGATAGLATNKAIDIMISLGFFQTAHSPDQIEAQIVELGGVIAKAALRLESGELDNAFAPKANGTEGSLPF